MKLSNLFYSLALAAAATAVQAQNGHQMGQARYGGPTYAGAPALAVTSSFIAAGGGPKKFSFAKAITSMVGPKLAKAEIAKLTKQYGKDKIKTWLMVGDYAVMDAIRLATKAGVKLPKPTLKGKDLAAAMVKAGLADDNTFYVEFMLDKALSHDIHMTVMDDIDRKYSMEADAEFHRITNQAMYDMAQALGLKQVKLAAFH